MSGKIIVHFCIVLSDRSATNLCDSSLINNGTQSQLASYRRRDISLAADQDLVLKKVKISDV